MKGYYNNLNTAPIHLDNSQQSVSNQGIGNTKPLRGNYHTLKMLLLILVLALIGSVTVKLREPRGSSLDISGNISQTVFSEFCLTLNVFHNSAFVSIAKDC